MVSMMISADEMEDCIGLPSFCTSTQMGNRNPQLRPVSLLLSPLCPQGHAARGGHFLEEGSGPVNEGMDYVMGSLLQTFILKESFQMLLSKITPLYNLLLNSGLFPDKWKEALVIPIPKTGAPTDVNNYRPISLLPLPGKVLEKLVHCQLSEFLKMECDAGGISSSS